VIDKPSQHHHGDGKPWPSIEVRRVRQRLDLAA
jgi:hypothetical protein